jgi:hypothetical protein
VKEHTAWTAANGQEAFLVLDRNRNGQVDSAEELFGNFTRMSNGNRAPNGFDALADLDAHGSSPDGVINSSDTVFEELRLWVDRNHDGISQADELSRLADSGITTIELSYQEVGRQDENGNRLRYQGRALVAHGGNETPRKIYDVYFSTRP